LQLLQYYSTSLLFYFNPVSFIVIFFLFSLFLFEGQLFTIVYLKFFLKVERQTEMQDAVSFLPIFEETTACRDDQGRLVGHPE